MNHPCVSARTGVRGATLTTVTRGVARTGALLTGVTGVAGVADVPWLPDGSGWSPPCPGEPSGESPLAALAGIVQTHSIAITAVRTAAAEGGANLGVAGSSGAHLP